MATDCYLVLGVPRDASISRIRRAFYRLCHQFDPDRADADSGAFENAFDAFETLTNPDRRLQHDMALHGTDARKPEPKSVTPEPVDLMRSFETHRPGRDELQDQFAKNFTGRRVPKSRPVRELTVELTISPDAAARGGRLPIDVPVAQRCGPCEGTGSTGVMPCPECAGHGLLWDVARVDVLLSPPVQNGMVIPVSLRHLGVQNTYLSVHVHVVPPQA
jgi:molecular chaperone DnaJ